jgi:hypothetical protein|nr:MAG TPA: hypothetical protein [Caudoviricetes sp.]
MIFKIAFFAVLGILFIVESTFIVNYINGIRIGCPGVFFGIGIVFVYMLTCIPDLKNSNKPDKYRYRYYM